MLIHYPTDQVPTRWSRELWDEAKTSEKDVQAEHVSDFLKRWLASKNLTLMEQKIVDLAGEIVSKANALASGSDPVPRLQSIHDLLTGALKDLEKENP
jgi:hypothetical protein